MIAEKEQDLMTATMIIIGILSYGIAFMTLNWWWMITIMLGIAYYTWWSKDTITNKEKIFN